VFPASLAVPVYYDFASTLSYVAHRILGRLAEPLAAAGITLVWRPIDLAAITGWERDAALDAGPRERVRDIARTLVGDVRVPRTWVDSRGIGGIAIGLAGTPAEAVWRERVWTAIFEEGRSPAEPGELARWTGDVGITLDTEARAVAHDAVARATRAARRAGVVAVPTLLLGAWPMAGIQDDATMLALLTRYAARSPRAPRPQ
jgi:2-hydroxychromene-2-carboxylate isomerase